MVFWPRSNGTYRPKQDCRESFDTACQGSAGWTCVRLVAEVNSIVKILSLSTLEVARGTFPKGNPYLTLRDKLGIIYEEKGFIEFFPEIG